MSLAQIRLWLEAWLVLNEYDRYVDGFLFVVEMMILYSGLWLIAILPCPECRCLYLGICS